MEEVSEATASAFGLADPKAQGRTFIKTQPLEEHCLRKFFSVLIVNLEKQERGY